MVATEEIAGIALPPGAFPTRQVSASLTELQIIAIDAIAKERGASRSETLGSLLMQGLASSETIELTAARMAVYDRIAEGDEWADFLRAYNERQAARMGAANKE